MKLTITDTKFAPKHAVFTEGLVELPKHDADLNIAFPSGIRAVLQWRIEHGTLDFCFGAPVHCYNDGPDMEPAPSEKGRPECHTGVMQLTIMGDFGP